LTSFSRVKYLVIMELTIANLFAQVIVVSIRCHAVGFFAFAAGSLGASWNSKNPPAALLLQNNPSLVSVEFHNYKDSVMRVARILWVPIALKDILQKAKGITLIESNQIRWFSWGSDRRRVL
jgi:hypothetical protein